MIPFFVFVIFGSQRRVGNLENGHIVEVSGHGTQNIAVCKRLAEQAPYLDVMFPG